MIPNLAFFKNKQRLFQEAAAAAQAGLNLRDPKPACSTRSKLCGMHAFALNTLSRFEEAATSAEFGLDLIPPGEHCKAVLANELDRANYHLELNET